MIIQNIDFSLSALSSIEVINFSSELSFLLAKLKTEIWHSFVCDVIIVNIQGGNPHPF